MDIRVKGNTFLKGNVFCSGAKNAALPLLCASLLAKGKVLFRNVPRISDIFDISQILRYLGCRVIFKGHTMLVDNTNLVYKPLFYEECKKIRGSYYFIGVFLALFSKCEIWLPGGCQIGKRPIDIHLQAFEDLGFTCKIEDRILTIYRINANEEATITLKNKSVGATINALFACLSLNNVTIMNGLFEPEGLDILNFLQKIGYQVSLQNGIVTYTKSPLEFKFIKHTIIPDRIEALTYTVLGLLTGDIYVKRINTKDISYPLEILSKAGYDISYTDNEIHAKKSFGTPLDIKTAVYPGIPTDIQAIFGVLMIKTIGVSQIEETIFENRLQIYSDLCSSGVECEVLGNIAKVKGTNLIHSKNYKAFDLRHGAALMLLALMGDKESIIENFEYALRGYDDFINHIKAMGGKITIL